MRAGYCRAYGLSEKSLLYWKRRVMPSEVAISLMEVSRFQPMPVLSPSRLLRLR